MPHKELWTRDLTQRTSIRVRVGLHVMLNICVFFLLLSTGTVYSRRLSRPRIPIFRSCHNRYENQITGIGTIDRLYFGIYINSIKYRSLDNNIRDSSYTYLLNWHSGMAQSWCWKRFVQKVAKNSMKSLAVPGMHQLSSILRARVTFS